MNGSSKVAIDTLDGVVNRSFQRFHTAFPKARITCPEDMDILFKEGLVQELDWASRHIPVPVDTRVQWVGNKQGRYRLRLFLQTIGLSGGDVSYDGITDVTLDLEQQPK